MWKVMVAVLVLGFIAYRFADRPAANGPAAVGAGAVYEGFVEVRMLMQSGQREIELVAVEERPDARDCEKPETATRLKSLCPTGRGISCSVKSLECVRDVEPRYRKMLEQQPVSVHYAHLQVDGAAGPRRAVLLGWGMTEQESQLLCSAVQASAAKSMKGTVTCI